MARPDYNAQVSTNLAKFEALAKRVGREDLVPIVREAVDRAQKAKRRGGRMGAKKAKPKKRGRRKPSRRMGARAARIAQAAKPPVSRGTALLGGAALALGLGTALYAARRRYQEQAADARLTASLLRSGTGRGLSG